MRVGIDYLLASTHAPGLGRYTREMVRALAHLPNGPELRLWEWGAMARGIPRASLGLPTELPIHRTRLPGRWQPWADRLGFGVERQLGPMHVFHRVRPLFPKLRETPWTVPVVRLPKRDSEQGEGLAQELSQARGVFVFCAHYAARLAREWKVPAHRIAQVPVGCEHWARDAPLLDTTRETKRIKTFAVLGALRSARRSASLLQAWPTLRAQGGDHRLRFYGYLDPKAGDLSAALRGAAVHDVQQTLPQESEMPRLLREAHALVHLAEEEGSPVTPLEAARLGLHLILEDLPAFREAFPPDGPVQPLWLPKNPDPDAIAEALAACAERPPAAPCAVPGYTWQACAQAHWDAWQDWHSQPPLA